MYSSLWQCVKRLEQQSLSKVTTYNFSPTQLPTLLQLSLHTWPLPLPLQTPTSHFEEQLASQREHIWLTIVIKVMPLSAFNSIPACCFLNFNTTLVAAIEHAVLLPWVLVIPATAFSWLCSFSSYFMITNFDLEIKIQGYNECIALMYCPFHSYIGAEI